MMLLTRHAASQSSTHFIVPEIISLGTYMRYRDFDSALGQPSTWSAQPEYHQLILTDNTN